MKEETNHWKYLALERSVYCALVEWNKLQVGIHPDHSFKISEIFELSGPARSTARDTRPSIHALICFQLGSGISLVSSYNW